MPNRSSDFRFIFTNVLGVQFSDNDLRLLFAIDEGDGVDSAFEQMGVAMTHKTAKLLGHMLVEIIASYEARTGVAVPLDADKIADVRSSIEAATLASSNG